MPEEPRAGLRFSLAYGRRGEPTSDSARMRRRMAALVNAADSHAKDALAMKIEREHGVNMSPFVSSVGYDYATYDWGGFLAKADLRDVLDLVSTAMGMIGGVSWLAEIRRIFEEEHVAYSVDNAGGVRFSIDAAFELDQAATIAALGGPKYAATAAAFELTLKHMSEAPPRGKDAIRAVFSAVEGLFRQMFSSAPRLGGAEIDTHLQPVIANRFLEAAARGAALKSLRSFKAWVDAAHFYRHEPNHAEPTEPPLELAILLISGGATWLRWLAEVDGAGSVQ